MSVNFGLLRPTDIGAQISAGAQDVKNAMLRREQQTQAREMQRQQIEGLAEQRRAAAADRQSMVEQRQQAAAAAQQRQEWLTGFATKLAEGGHKLDRPTMSQMIASPIPEIQQLGLKGLQELDAEEKFRSAFSGGAPAAPGAAFDTQAVQGQINALLALRDPRAQAAAGQLQRQIEAEERRVNNLRDDVRQRERDAQMAADREEARRLRLTIAAGRGGGAPATSGGDIASMTDAQLLKIVGPGVVEVIDPTDGTKKIVSRVQAARMGATSAKESNIDVKSDAARTKTRTAVANINDVLSTMEASYKMLADMGGIVDSDKGPIANTMARTEASAPGQLVSGFVGSKAQTERDKIKNVQLRLLNAMKNAEGTGVGQLNSNMELQTAIQSLGDPRQSKQAVEATLSNIRRIVNNAAAEAARAESAPAAPPAAPPAAGRDIGGGFRVVN